MSEPMTNRTLDALSELDATELEQVVLAALRFVSPGYIDIEDGTAHDGRDYEELAHDIALALRGRAIPLRP